MKPRSRRPLPDQPELLKSLRKRVKDVHSFWRTRRAIRDGKLLYDYAKTDLESNGLMGPWTFNLAESVFVAIPALATSKVLSFLYPPPEITPLFSADATFGQKLLDTTLALFDSVFSMTLLFGAPAVGWTLLILFIILAVLVAVVLAALKLTLVG